MASAQPTPKSQTCLLKERLIAELEAALNRIASIEMELTLGGLAPNALLADELEVVRERKNNVLQAFKKHIGEHGC